MQPLSLLYELASEAGEHESMPMRDHLTHMPRLAYAMEGNNYALQLINLSALMQWQSVTHLKGESDCRTWLKRLYSGLSASRASSFLLSTGTLTLEPLALLSLDVHPAGGTHTQNSMSRMNVSKRPSAVHISQWHTARQGQSGMTHALKAGGDLSKYQTL